MIILYYIIIMHYETNDLTKCPYAVIAHQCNTRTRTSKGLSAAMFRKFPSANTYDNGFERVAGNISVHTVGEQRIVNMYGQVHPSRPGHYNDSASDRIRYFKSCLDQMAALPDLTSVAFPDHIGCGLAGGDWDVYHRMIAEFADKIAPARVIIVKLS